MLNNKLNIHRRPFSIYRMVLCHGVGFKVVDQAGLRDEEALLFSFPVCPCLNAHIDVTISLAIS